MSYVKKPEGVFVDPATMRCYEHKGYAKRIYWSEQMLRDLRTKYPVMPNTELASMLGVSVSTLLRKVKELDIRKNQVYLAKVKREGLRLAVSCNKVKGNPGAYKKGQPARPSSFKRGHKFPEEIEKKRVEALRAAIKRRRIRNGVL